MRRQWVVITEEEVSLLCFSRLETSETLVWLMTFQHSIWTDSTILSSPHWTLLLQYFKCIIAAIMPVNKPVFKFTGLWCKRLLFFFLTLLGIAQLLWGSEIEKGKSEKGFEALISRDRCCFCSMGGSWVEGQARRNNRPLHHNSVSTDPPTPPLLLLSVNNIISPTLRGDVQGDPGLVYAFQ